MKEVVNKLYRVESKLLKWADAYCYSILRMSIGFIYTLFGILKFFPSHSPAEQLAVNTIEELSIGLLSGNAAILSLAVFETGLGLCLIFHYRLRLAVYVAVGHMLGTFLPFFFFPEQAFTSQLSLSLLGQYIIKNFVVVGALFVLYAKSAKRESKVIMMAAFKETEASDSEHEDTLGFLQEKQQRKQAITLSR